MTHEYVSKDASEKDRKECLKIREDIEAELKIMPGSELKPLQNPLYSIKVLDNDRTKQVGTLSAISDHVGMMDNIYSYLSPKDVVQLELTCKRFVNVERTQRIAIGSWLLSASSLKHIERGLSKETSKETVEKALNEYINSTTNVCPKVAIQKLFSEASSVMDRVLFMNNSYLKMDPLLFEAYLESVFYKQSPEYGSHVLYKLIYMDFDMPRRRDFQLAKLFLRLDNDGLELEKRYFLGQMKRWLEDGSNETVCADIDNLFGVTSSFTERFFYHSLDIDVMRVLASIEVVGFNGDLHQLKEAAHMVLACSTLRKSIAKRRETSREDPLYAHSMEFSTFYKEHIPSSWPGLVSIDWDNNSSERESIEQYWVDEPAMLRIWKVALFKALEWVYKLEREGCISDYLLLSRIIQGEEIMRRPNSPINSFSLGPFLIMQSVESGGAVALSVKMDKEGYMTDLFYNYYEFVKLCRKGFRKEFEMSPWASSVING